MSDAGPNEYFRSSSFLQGQNADYMEQLHARFTASPDSVDATWRRYFELIDGAAERAPSQLKPSWQRPDWPKVDSGELVAAFDGQWPETAASLGSDLELKIRALAAGGGISLPEKEVQQRTLDSIRALMLIRAYRIRGHRIAMLDPLGLTHHTLHPELAPETYGFLQEDMDRPVFIDNVLGLETATIREILAMVRRTYCGTFALQYMHISDPEQSAWLKERIEGYGKEVQFTQEGRRAILRKLIEAEGFEKFLQAKYTGTKRFGLDGAESVVPAMEQFIKRGGALGVKEIVIGMPHRGRLNFLANVMGKPYRAILNEFKGGSFKPDDVAGSGDVKYHLGASSDREFDGNVVHLSLTANPSHLEAVNAVVLGKARAKQTQRGDPKGTTVLPILLHGDAAFAGQGIVAECFGLSGLVGHATGGTIHLIVNNQIGFTTAPHYSRSSPYPTDIAMMTESPIFHVNGDDPEAVVHAAKVATEFRQKFCRDVVVDIFCYRRFGHNEGDEPMFTQPKMYRIIKNHPTTLELYSERLASDGLVPFEETESNKKAFRDMLDQEFELADSYKPNDADWLDGRWSHIQSQTDDDQRGKTGVSLKKLKKIGAALVQVPKGFGIHPTLSRLLRSRKQIIDTGKGCNWAVAEALAFGSLLQEGYGVRLSGQDSTRGTFSQRHSAFIDQDTEEKHVSLNHIPGNKAKFQVIDSMLSEFAVLGFEYGYTLSEPNTLVMWEAQFGDFANGAQTMFDQFIASGERKWLRMSGLVMLLPHGFEGQGPEHSSARLERFLQLCAEDNWIVANCTTPANYFHILRRQMHRDFRKPLVLMTPKSLLRHKLAVSLLDEFKPGTSFHRVLWDDAERGNSDNELVPDDKIRKVVITSGKVYFDLLEERDARGIDDIYLLRVEQYYPFPALALIKELSRFGNAEMIWCQEEPRNQGAWHFIEPNLEWVLGKVGAKSNRVGYVGRVASASPATGLLRQHQEQQRQIVDEALNIAKD
ncbi:MAG: 2-oxoglutarate dehydrogenase E1 component [Rhodobacteraceae bacterium]|nr:2-oxoglutarate dehydrogenase E1 component [Paracoccaceae bacterium]